MTLQLDELGLLDTFELDEMFDEIKEVSGRNEVVLLGRAHQPLVEVPNSHVKLDDALTQELIPRVVLLLAIVT